MAQTVDHAHGRTEIRTLHVQAGLDGWSAWPGVGQVCRILHQVRRRGHWQVELHYKITSLPPERASPSDLLRLGRSHWSIENQLHYVRDVTLGEDTSRIRTGAAPQVMAAVRNLVLTVLRLAGVGNLASGLRHFGWDPERAIVRLGLRSDPAHSTQLTSAA
jgi:Transposase DDE domain